MLTVYGHSPTGFDSPVLRQTTGVNVPDPPVKCWTENGVAVATKMPGAEPGFVFLVNTTDQTVVYRRHRLKPYETYFSLERHVLQDILGTEAGGSIKPIHSSSVAPPKVAAPSVQTGPASRYIKLKGKVPRDGS